MDAPDFEAALDAQRPAMWALAWRLAGADAAAEDVVQDALLQVWRTRDSSDPTRGSLRTWLLVLVADRCRKRRRRPPTTAPPDQLAGPVVDDASDLDLRRAVAGLAPRQRLAVEPVSCCATPSG